MKKSQSPGRRRKWQPAPAKVFYAVLGLTLFFAIASIVLTLCPFGGDSKQSLVDACSKSWHMGFCVIIGLLSGRS